MRIHIRHQTTYAYDRPVDYAAQLLRLTPQSHDGQWVVWWRLAHTDGRPLPSTDDGYGNILHVLTLTRAHQSATVIAEGEVETSDRSGIVRGGVERLPPAYWLRTTALTEPSERLREIAEAVRGRGDALEVLHALMEAVHRHVRYAADVTDTGTTADEAVGRGAGVCQDHAHVFASCARLLGHPARYVGGYLQPAGSGGATQAGHAWAEAWVGELGWIGFDAANFVCPTDSYVRVAIGLDYSEACPVRGVRRGLAEETMSVLVDVRPAGAQQ
ncbi:MAG TPA: transglutaminase family protein [Candidatus Limnocylindrales bacterium]|nr:transglutaminase family protein [Candidatus Limnocylindrales bacterium]